MFKVGDNLICVNNDGMEEILAIGNHYLVVWAEDTTEEQGLHVKTRDGDETYAFAFRFELEPTIHNLKRENETLRRALNEWLEKSEWLQTLMSKGKLPAKYLGLHRMDIINDLIQNDVKTGIDQIH